MARHDWDIQKDRPLVSVCTITYNHIPYIQKCLDKILMQETNFPFELIVHDDASTDGTTDIVREYANKYPEVIVPIFQSENQYSKGIKISPIYVWPQARGKYIALCEGDDYWTDPKKLQKQVDFLEANPEYSLSFHNANTVWEDGTSSNRLVVSKKIPNRDYSTKHIIRNKVRIATGSMVFRKEYLFPLSEWRNQTTAGDRVIQLILSMKGKTHYFADTMSIYRLNESSVSKCYSDLDRFKIYANLFYLFSRNVSKKYMHYMIWRLISFPILIFVRGIKKKVRLLLQKSEC